MEAHHHNFNQINSPAQNHVDGLSQFILLLTSRAKTHQPISTASMRNSNDLSLLDLHAELRNQIFKLVLFQEQSDGIIAPGPDGAVSINLESTKYVFSLPIVQCPLVLWELGWTSFASLTMSKVSHGKVHILCASSHVRQLTPP